MKIFTCLKWSSRFLEKILSPVDDPLVKQRKSKKKAKREFKETFYRNKRNYPRSKRKYPTRDKAPKRKGYYRYIPKTHYYNPSDIHLRTSKQEKWNKLTCWLCGQTGHTSSRCPQGEESKLERGKKTAVYAQKAKQVKKEHSSPFSCLKCKSKYHVTENCPNLHITAQQHQLEDSSLDSFSSTDEEFQVNMGHYSDSDLSECSCSDSDECVCQVFYDNDSQVSDSSGEEEERPKPPKEKVLMASTEEEAEMKILAQTRNMEEGAMKDRLIEAFTEQLKSKASKESGKKPLFVDASYERNTKSFQMHHQKPGKLRSLTLGEVSGEIHQLKSEISAIKAQIAELKKGKEIKEEEEESWNIGSRHKEIEIAEGRSDPHFGFQDMRLFTITYQQHHVKVKICIQGQIFFMTALLDSGADINILNIRNIPAEYWVSAEREVVGLGNKKLKYEIPRASLCFDTHCVYMKFAIADIPVDCILGNVFLAAVEPHGSARIKGSKAGYFISVPTSREQERGLSSLMSLLPGSPLWSKLCRSWRKLNLY